MATPERQKHSEQVGQEKLKTWKNAVDKVIDSDHANDPERFSPERGAYYLGLKTTIGDLLAQNPDVDPVARANALNWLANKMLSPRREKLTPTPEMDKSVLQESVAAEQQLAPVYEAVKTKSVPLTSPTLALTRLEMRFKMPSAREKNFLMSCAGDIATLGRVITARGKNEIQDKQLAIELLGICENLINMTQIIQDTLSNSPGLSDAKKQQYEQAMLVAQEVIAELLTLADQYTKLADVAEVKSKFLGF